MLEAARYDLAKATALAISAQHLPISRFLLAPLKLKNPTPETFRLAIEAASDKEFIQMRKGDKLWETVVALGPLLGLLNTVSGLIRTFGNLDIGNSSNNNDQATQGIGEALIATATGMIVVITDIVLFRLFASL